MDGPRIFIAESVSAKDFYDGRVDGFAANEVLKIQAIATTYRVVLTKRLLAAAVKEAESWNSSLFHLSCHGDDNGIVLSAGTSVGWLEFAAMIRPIAVPGRSLVMSCCSGGYVGLSKALQKAGGAFDYVFGSTAVEGVGFTECCLAWSILHSRLVTYGFKPTDLRGTINVINSAVPGDFVYRKWNGSVYRPYPGFTAR